MLQEEEKVWLGLVPWLTTTILRELHNTMTDNNLLKSLSSFLTHKII